MNSTHFEMYRVVAICALFIIRTFAQITIFFQFTSNQKSSYFSTFTNFFLEHFTVVITIVSIVNLLL